MCSCLQSKNINLGSLMLSCNKGQTHQTDQTLSLSPGGPAVSIYGHEVRENSCRSGLYLLGNSLLAAGQLVCKTDNSQLTSQKLVMQLRVGQIRPHLYLLTMNY